MDSIVRFALEGAYGKCVLAFRVLALPAFLALHLRAAPYGRHAPSSTGGLPARLAWILMELPSALSFSLFTSLLHAGASLRVVCMSALWCAHYFNRGLVYPLRIQSQRRVPGWIIAAAAVFTTCNGALNA